MNTLTIYKQEEYHHELTDTQLIEKFGFKKHECNFDSDGFFWILYAELLFDMLYIII